MKVTVHAAINQGSGAEEELVFNVTLSYFLTDRSSEMLKLHEELKQGRT